MEIDMDMNMDIVDRDAASHVLCVSCYIMCSQPSPMLHGTADIDLTDGITRGKQYATRAGNVPRTIFRSAPKSASQDRGLFGPRP